MNEKDLLRDFRVPGAPGAPDALARGREILVRRMRTGATPVGPRPLPRPVLAAAAAAVVVLVLGVTFAVSTGADPRADDQAGDPLNPAAAPRSAQADQRLCADAGTPAAGGRDIWVSVDGDDAGTGDSPAEALADPQEAVDRAGPGDRVLLMSGTYTADRSTVLKVDHDGAAGRDIVVTAAPGADPVIRTGRQNWNAVLVTGSFVEVSGLVLEGHKDLNDLASAVALADVDDPRTSGNGLAVGAAPGSDRYPHDVLIRNNTVRDFPGGGIGAERTGSVTIECNRVSGNGTFSPFANSGISVGDNSSTDPGGGEIVVRRNVVHDNTSLVPRRSSDADPSLRTLGGGNGISCDGNDDTWRGTLLVQNNVTYANGAAGINLDHCDRVTVDHNTSSANGTRPGSTSGDIAVRNATDVELSSNLVVPSGARKGITAPPTTVEVNNLETADTRTFVDAPAGDYRVRCDGPAADAAGPGPTSDLVGTVPAPGSAPDIGALESC